ncbi:hypothetical protein [Aquimarina sp. BL5]|uniref:hypothetical protein n=1 Tax=Aquimarina sp. BL5 TaxID=1714860 RepID=UPI0013145D9F|nr:hypothetical protein [Aquimarina sp. BL5]
MQLKGAEILNKEAQKSINGGFGIVGMYCYSGDECSILNSIPGFEHEEFYCYGNYCHVA